MQVSVGELPIVKKWERELSPEGNVINWETVWDNISHCSKNPNHQQIHFNICHRTYWTPQKRYVSKAIPTSYCTFCQPEQTGTFLHMVWECEQVHEFWNKTTSIISDVIGCRIPTDPIVLLLNDDSKLHLLGRQKNIWLAGSTATKKMIAQRGHSYA